MTQATEVLLLTTNQVAVALSVSYSKARSLIDSGEIASLKIGGCRRVSAEVLRQWVADQVAQAAMENAKPEIPDFITALLPKPKKRKRA